MKTTLSPAGRIVVSALCLWHMAAVAIFAFPPEAEGWVQRARWFLLPSVRPYVLMFSQWQQWNLFSPDPMRRVTVFRIDIALVGPWTMLERLNTDSIPATRRSSWAKYFTGLLDDTSENREGIRRRFLELRCREHDLPAGTKIQLVLETRVLPRNETVQSPSWWIAARLPIKETVATVTQCPA